MPEQRPSPSDALIKRYPKLKFLRSNEEAAAVVDKLVQDRTGSHSPQRSNRRIDGGGDYLMEKISDRTASNISDANSIFQLLPDMELAKQILVSSILAPKDLISSELTYTVEEVDDLPSDIAQGMSQVVQDFFDNTYKIKNLLPTILEDVLFMRGSYPMAVLPENAIDDAINSPARVSNEAIREELDTKNGRAEPLGLLGPNKEDDEQGSTVAGIESMINDNSMPGLDAGSETVASEQFNTTVTDNFSVLKLPMLTDKIRQDKIKDRLSARNVGTEARKNATKKKAPEGFNEGEFEASLYAKRNYPNVPIMPIKTKKEAGGETTGHPLVMRLPSESVIPVHTPSTPDDHVGYFILIDEMGNPVTRATESDYYNELGSNFKQSQGLGRELLQQAQRGMSGRQRTEQELDTQEATRLYMDVIERDLLARLKNGAYGNSVEISRPETVYRIMFARACANMRTQLLYVPAELMTYFAFDYNQFGIGRSLLENSKIVGSVRSMLLFAQTMGQIKNSVGRTSLEIELDEKDPDPSGTVEFLRNEYARTSQARYPIGVQNPVDIINYLQNANIDLQVSGNTAYPETKVQAEDRSSDKTEVDTDLEEEMKKRHLMSVGLSPEMVDVGLDVDFATSIVSSNVLLSKRVMVYQSKLLPQVKDFMFKYAINSQYLMDDLRAVVENNQQTLTDEQKEKDPDEIIERFFEALEVQLPKPDTASMENQMEAFENFSRGLEDAIEAYVSSDFLTEEMLGELEMSVDTVRYALMAYYKRQWLQRNNVFPEMAELLARNEDGEHDFSLLKVQGEYLEHLADTMGDFMVHMKKKRAKLDEKMKAADDEIERERQEREEARRQEEEGGEEEDEDLAGMREMGAQARDQEEQQAGEGGEEDEEGGEEETEEGGEEGGQNEDEEQEGSDSEEDDQEEGGTDAGGDEGGGMDLPDFP